MVSQENKIVMITWKDAAYTFNKILPFDLPPVQIVIGFLLEKNRDYINIAMNVDFNSDDGSIDPVDGLVIPRSAILKIRKLKLLK